MVELVILVNKKTSINNHPSLKNIFCINDKPHVGSIEDHNIIINKYLSNEEATNDVVAEAINVGAELVNDRTNVSSQHTFRNVKNCSIGELPMGPNEG